MTLRVGFTLNVMPENEVTVRAKDIRLVAIDQIIPNSKNRNLHTAEQIEQLKHIIRYQGFRVPVIISNRSGKLVAGHGRLLAAQGLNLKEIPAIYQDFDSEEQEWAAGISDNSIGAWAELDLSGINFDLPEHGPDFDIDLLGIKDFVLDISEKEDEPTENETSSDDDNRDKIPEELPPKSAVKLGDTFILGNSKLTCGDCLYVLKAMPDNSADSLVTDPPAGISFMGKEWDDDKGGREEWIKWLSDVMREAHRVLKPGAHGLVWAIPRTSHWTGNALENAGFEVRDVVTHLFGTGFPKASHLLNDKSGALCRCVYDTHNNEHSGLSLSGVVRRGTADSSVGGDLLPSDARHLSDMSSGSRGDCRLVDDLYDAPARLDEAGGQAVSPLQQCAQEHTRSDGREDVEGSVASHIPSSVQYTDLLSSPDCSRRSESVSSISIDTLENTKALGNKSTQTDSVASGHHKSHTALKSSAFPFCTICGKPRPEGWYNGGLKPAAEMWWLIRKPCSEDTVAANVLKWGTGGINIDGCRIGTEQTTTQAKKGMYGAGSAEKMRELGFRPYHVDNRNQSEKLNPPGRFPANLILSCCGNNPHDADCAVAMLDEQGGVSGGGTFKGPNARKRNNGLGLGNETIRNGASGAPDNYGDIGGPSRFFYIAKPSAAEKNAGLDEMPTGQAKGGGGTYNEEAGRKYGSIKAPAKNIHPTVKALSLMSYLAKLITPPNGRVLEPFGGSGTTLVAATQNGFSCTLAEMSELYCHIIIERWEHFSKAEAYRESDGVKWSDIKARESLS